MDLNVLIVGGGIHGVGVMHDLATRRIKGVHLVEQNALASGTSSRSTKLVHGGLRYLENWRQWGLVREALQERGTLLRILQGLVQPLPFVLPVFKTGRPAWMLRTGLFLYDTLAGDSGLPSARPLSLDKVYQLAPYLNRERLQEQASGAFLYYDAQMLDDVIVRLAAKAAEKLGATYEETTQALSVTPIQSPTHGRGFRVTLSGPGGKRELTTKIIVNAAGAWCNANLLRWGILPQIRCLLNTGSHMVFKREAVQGADLSHSAAALLQNSDGRVVFFIPWNGQWLFGTTESVLQAGEPKGIKPSGEDLAYLTKAAQHSLNIDIRKEMIVETFCGIRTMPIQNAGSSAFSPLTFRGSSPALTKAPTSDWQQFPFDSPYYVRHSTNNISGLSRETILNETIHGLISVYGGKYTTYRAQCEKIGALVSRKLGLGGTSGTQCSENWFLPELFASNPELFKTAKQLRSL